MHEQVWSPDRSDRAEVINKLVEAVRLKGKTKTRRRNRFPTAAHLASYAGLVPRVHSSGGHTRMGQVCGNVNCNLKWAFVETANLIVINQRRLGGTHVVRLYQRIKRAKNHQKAAMAVAATLQRLRSGC